MTQSDTREFIEAYRAAYDEWRVASERRDAMWSEADSADRSVAEARGRKDAAEQALLDAVTGREAES